MTWEELAEKYLRALAAADMKAWRAYQDHVGILFVLDEQKPVAPSLPKSEASVRRYQRRSTRDDTARTP